MSLDLLPDLAPPVPTFSPAVEDAIDRALEARLGRTPTDQERSDYRQVLWAFATAIQDILDAPRSSSTSVCPASPSTSEKAVSRTTSSA